MSRSPLRGVWIEIAVGTMEELEESTSLPLAGSVD